MGLYFVDVQIHVLDPIINMYLLDPSVDKTGTGLRAIPHDVQGVEVKKKAAPFRNVSAKKRKALFIWGGSQLFAYFCFSRPGLEPNPREKRRMCVPLSALPYAFITCCGMKFEESIIFN
jgi:hypothetical protein